MKVKITLILGLILSISVQAKAVEICESKGVPEIGGSSVNSILSPMKSMSDSEIKSIANKLCANIKFASSSEFNPAKFKNIILVDLDVSSQTSDSQKNKIVSDFLNNNKQSLICPESKDDAYDRDMHFLKTALLEGVIDLYDEIILDDDEYEIDLNAFEIIDGKKETVVDYLDKLLNSKFKGDTSYELLRDDIIDMGGKRGAEL